jgi:hypothetical protein
MIFTIVNKKQFTESDKTQAAENQTWNNGKRIYSVLSSEVYIYKI